MRLLLALSLVAMAIGCGWADRPTSEEIVLEPGMRIQRTVSGGRPHHIRFPAQPGQFLHLGIEQQGVDVVAFLFDPANRLLFEIDSPVGKNGWEFVLSVAPAQGVYRLEVKPLAADAGGDFAFEVLELREATQEDRWRAESSAAFAAAERRRREKEFASAAESYRKALPGLEALEDRKGLARTRWRLGEALVETGELLRAQTTLEDAAAAFRSLEDDVGEARALNDLGGLWRELGELDRADSAYRRSLELYRAAGKARGEATLLNNLGLVAEKTGDMAGALGLYEEALGIWQRLGRRSAEAVTLQNLGSLHALVGRDEEALDLLHRAVSLRVAEGQDRKLVSAWIALGWGHYLAGQSEQALEKYGQAIDLAWRLEDRLGEAGARGRQGTAYRVLGRAEEAAESYRTALEIFHATGRRFSEGHTLANLGWLALSTGDPESAAEKLNEALEILSDAGDQNAEVYALVGLARAARLRDDLETARQILDRAIGLIESLRSEVKGGLSQSYFLATRYDAFEDMVTLLAELHQRRRDGGYDRQALEYAERARARELLEGLAETARLGRRTPDESDSPRRRQLQEIHALEARRMTLVDKDPLDPKIEHLEKLLRQRWLAIECLEDSGETGDPARQAPLTADEIQELADAETVLLFYFLAEPDSFAWTVDREGVEIHRLSSKQEIEERARRLAAVLPRSHEIAFEEQTERNLTALSEVILEPLRSRLAGYRRVVVLADGALHHVPFAALPVPRAGSSPEPLLRRHEIVTLASASVLAHQRRSLADRPSLPGAIAVIADPVFGPEDERLTGVEVAAEGLPPDLDRAVRAFDMNRLERLTYTAAEAKAVLAHVPGRSTLEAVGFEADRKLVESEALGRYRIVHFATHGLINPVHPELSGLVLSLLDPAGESRDGFLRAHEVAALDLPAEMVVLSACSTGQGREIRGEGLVGLTQAFFRAGARRVVVSSWNVSDAATAELMASFYRHLFEERLPPASALREAQISILDQERWKAPYFWASFTLTGDWQ